jgi:hypothetical protein
MSKNNDELKKMIDKYSLKQPDVAAYTESSIDAVKGWCVSSDSNRFRNMPGSKLKLLKLELRENT